MSRIVAKSRSGFGVHAARDAKTSVICLACSVSIPLPPSCRARLLYAPASAVSDGGSPPNCTSFYSISGILLLQWAATRARGCSNVFAPCHTRALSALLAVPAYLRTHPQTFHLHPNPPPSFPNFP